MWGPSIERRCSRPLLATTVTPILSSLKWNHSKANDYWSSSKNEVPSLVTALHHTKKYWLTPPRPRIPPPRPPRVLETPRSCTGDHFSRLVFTDEDAMFNFLARRTISISCWWLVNCGEAENALKIGKRGHFNSAAARKRVDLRTLFGKDSKFKWCWENMKVVPTQESCAWSVERWRISFAKRFQDGSAGHSGRN